MNDSEILIYQAADGKINIDVRLEDETIWLAQDHMAVLFDKSRKRISEQLRNIFSEGELDERVVVRNFRTTTRHCAMPDKTPSREAQFCSLDVISSVGYRVKSHQGTQFRIWATQRLREYIVKGFASNDGRFKKGKSTAHFTELQGRIHEIRLSGRFFYQKIKDIDTASIDYDPRDENSIPVFKMVRELPSIICEKSCKCKALHYQRLTTKRHPRETIAECN